MIPLTIIIPNYNRSSWLQKTLQTLTYQSNKQFQVILVDHGSTENIRAIFDIYRQELSIEYYWIPRDNYFSPAIPRDFGVRKAGTPLIAFLDTGMLVPSFYVAAHLAFHQRFPKHVAIGLQHGGDVEGESRERMAALLKRVDKVDELEEIMVQSAEWCDRRSGRKLSDLVFPWKWGWSANMSLSTEAYREAGGFNLDLKGWGFEDVDLCYRLHKCGLDFALVENGWGIENPHPRTEMKERMETHDANVYHCYQKQRSLALETLLYSRETWEGAEETFLYLTALGQSYSALPALSEEIWQQFARPSLLIGGTKQEGLRFDSVALANEQIVSTPSLWSCSGVVIPMPDRSLETVVISDIWKKLGWSHSFTTHTLDTSLLAYMISEIRRTAQKAYFINVVSARSLSDHSDVSAAELESLCHKHNLPFQLIPCERS